jgi:SAM-dependent methyltransferase
MSTSREQEREPELMQQLVLDLCSGARMFWFDRNNSAAIFGDKRRERHSLKDSTSKHGARMFVIEPDILLDFTRLPFADAMFPMVVFDPPHLIRNGRSGWLAKKYGKLGDDWREDISKGFAEAFRVLKEDGTLIFKWNERDIPVSQVLALTPVAPLIGNRCGRSAQSHWVVFMKPRSSLRRISE